MKKFTTCTTLLLYGLVIIAQTTSEASLISSTSDPIVIDCREGTVIPYGNSKILTFTDVTVNKKMVSLSYKLEDPMPEKTVLIANYTGGNVACATKSFHYLAKSVTSMNYTMTEHTIKFVPSPQSFVSGNVLVRIFFIEGQSTATPMQAISNVVSVPMEF